MLPATGTAASCTSLPSWDVANSICVTAGSLRHHIKVFEDAARTETDRVKAANNGVQETRLLAELLSQLPGQSNHGTPQ